jgi:DnaJ-class molecular chaperone
VSIAEALLGGRVELHTPQGRVKLAVPPCTSSGTVLRLRGKGAATPDGKPADLCVAVRIVVPRQLDEASKDLIEQFARLNPESPRG